MQGYISLDVLLSIRYNFVRFLLAVAVCEPLLCCSRHFVFFLNECVIFLSNALSFNLYQSRRPFALFVLYDVS